MANRGLVFLFKEIIDIENNYVFCICKKGYGNGEGDGHGNGRLEHVLGIDI